MELNLRENFRNIINALEEQGYKPTKIANLIGYTTTAQMHNVISGNGLLSTKAAISLINNLGVNPTYLYLGKGNMFISEEDEEKKGKEELEFKKSYTELSEKVKTLEKSNDLLVDMATKVSEFHKYQLLKEHELGIAIINFLKENGYANFGDTPESEISLKLKKFLDQIKGK